MMDIQKVSFDYFGWYGRISVEDIHFPELRPALNRLYYIHDGFIDVMMENEVKRLEKGHLYLIPNSLSYTMYTNCVDHTSFNFFTFPRIQHSSIIDIPLENEPILEAQIQALSLFVEKFPRVWVNTNQDYMNLVASSLYNILFFIKNIYKKLPEGEALYPEDIVTEETMRDVTEEVIREKILLNTSDEIPHSVAVKVENYFEQENIDKIYASIFCETKSQKGILIGKSGSMLKKIGTEARKELENITEKKVYLELNVKVEKDWRKKQSSLNNFGYKQEN